MHMDTHRPSRHNRLALLTITVRHCESMQDKERHLHVKCFRVHTSGCSRATLAREHELPDSQDNYQVCPRRAVQTQSMRPIVEFRTRLHRIPKSAVGCAGPRQPRRTQNSML